MSYKNSSNQKITKFKTLASSIAHETRNPLSAIKNCCDIIKDNLDEAVEHLELISISSNRGLQIIDMILSNIREEKIDENNFRNLSIADIVNKAVKEYAFESKKEKSLVNINLDNDFIFKGDETLMIFVLFNLLRNALYYKAKINIWLERAKNKNLLYFVDYGVGIDKNKISAIFDDFFTCDKKGGTGVGLPFCKRIIRNFGGDIGCKSVKGEFTEFVLSFPK